jgi:predicted Na+-dependent transporter
VSLSITMTLISSLLAFATLPLLLMAWTQPFTSETVRIPYENILVSLLLVIIPVAIGVYAKTKHPRVARYLEKGATVLGVIFIVAALVYGITTEADVLRSPASLWISSFALVLAGAGFGYCFAVLSRLKAYQARTIALETGIQNSTLTIAILTFSFGNDPRLPTVLRFPLLFSSCLIVSGVVLSVVFWYLGSLDSEEDVAERLAHDLQEQQADARDEAGADTGGDIKERLSSKSANVRDTKLPLGSPTPEVELASRNAGDPPSAV